MSMEEQEIVIVGAGIAGLGTALGLHRLGLRSLVLESSDSVRATGFALTLWTNAWRALDALGVGDSLRQQSLQLRGFYGASAESGLPISKPIRDKDGDYESRCVQRRILLETMEKELPPGTIKCSSKVVSIQESDSFKLVHLADGSILKTKVLVGCDGVNSVVAKWLGLAKPVSAGRSAIRGFIEYPNGHGFKPQFSIFMGGGVRFGFIPCDEKGAYWFCTFTPSAFQYDEDMEENPVKMKQFVLSKLSKIPREALDVVEKTKFEYISCAQLKLRLPWKLSFGDIVKGNVCVTGDAFHPMTPDLGQGGCSALEDSVVLARCLGEALSGGGGEFDRIQKGLKKYEKERRWRSFSLVGTAYVVGFLQETNGKVISFLRETFLAGYLIGATLRMADFDCGNLTVS